MAQIKVRTTQAGEDRFTAYIRIKRKGVVVHQESETFPRRALATTWAKGREVALANPDTLARAQMGEVAISSLIQRYIDEFEKTAKWARTKATSLRQLRAQPIASHNAITIEVDRIVQHVRERRASGIDGSTAGNDLTWLAVVFRAAAAVWKIPANVDAVVKARVACRELRLISKSRQRDRTPNYDELKRLDAYFEVQDGRSNIPMRDIMWFGIYSSRREAEITRLLWEDNDTERQLGLVRDAKHPTAKEGNHRRFRYTREAWEIAQRQPKNSPDGRIFPYNAKSVCTRFTRACRVLNIVDLHFHDLRHEATTRLFEQGREIPEVSAHTLHESWAVLKRYTHLVRRVKLFHAPFLRHSETSPTPAGRR